MDIQIKQAVEDAISATIAADRRKFADSMVAMSQVDQIELMAALGEAVIMAANGDPNAFIPATSLLPDAASSRELLSAVTESDADKLRSWITEDYIDFENSLIALAAALRQGSGQTGSDEHLQAS